jgi:hypothetical protein
MRLSEKAMLVSVNMSCWTARKKDARVTKEVAERYAASENSGQYTKALIAKEHLERITKSATAARSYHYRVTLPWLDNGARILPADLFPGYSAKMREFRTDFEDSVNAFLDNYPTLVDQARFALNGLFNDADYPSPEQMPKKFRFETTILPLPETSDFRIQLQSEDMEKIQADTEARFNALHEQAKRDICERISEYVGRMAERLSGEKNIFRDTLVENLQELVALISGLNSIGDPKLEEIRQEIEEKLTKHSPQMLRDHKPARRETAKAAQEIMDKMGAYFG